LKAQDETKKFVDKHIVHFQIEDWVYLKLQPYRLNDKLSP